MNRQKIFDSECELKTTGAVVSSSAMATVDGSVVTFDTGGGFTKGYFVVEITTAITEAIDASHNQGISIQLRGSSLKAFTSEKVLAELSLGYPGGHSAGARVSTDSAGTIPAEGTRWCIPFTNDYGGTLYRYLRCYHAFDGTISTGIDYIAFLSI